MTENKTSDSPSKIVYVQDLVPDRVSKLYTLDLQTGQADLVGTIATDVYDLAFAGSQLYGLKQSDNNTQLVEIDRNTGEATSIGEIGFAVVGLAYNYQRETLYATAAKQLVTLDLETGKGTPVMTVSKDKRVCGEVAFDDAGKAYITLIGTNRKKQLASCDLDRGKVKVIGDTGFPDLASMEFVDNVLYGVTGNFFDLGKDGQLVRIDTKTGKGAVITQTNPASRWAGMTVGDQIAVSSTPDTTNNNSDSETSIIEEKEMQLLTIDTQNNCYVIDPAGMNGLQENVASKITLEQGNFEIQITSGSYSYSNSAAGEPAVLLWIYGNNGSSFINQDTGVETGATWTTLNGYQQKLRLEVKQQAVVCALFFKVGNDATSGAIELTVTSDRAELEPQQLTVDSQNNCYSLDSQYLSSLKQWDNNFIELEPGNYRLKIQSANASYWSDEQQFDLEPWALMWLKAGSFITKLTEIETSETWCSLNGFEDEFILEVKSKTTISGLFFDTYKEDNQGQIVIGIEPLSDQAFTEICSSYQRRISEGGSVNRERRETVTTGSSSSRSSRSSETVTVGSSFNFRFDQEQMESTWRSIAAQVEKTVVVTDEQDPKKEALYWDSLEKWLLKGYQSQAKELAMQVARLEFMMKSITQQMEVSFNQNFEAWSGHFDDRLDNLISTRITTIVDDQVNSRLRQQTQDIKKLVVDQIQGEVEQRIDTIVNLKVANLSQDIKTTSLEQIEVDLDQRLANTINLNIDQRSTEITEAVIARIQTDMDERIGNLINLRITEQGQETKKIAIAEIKADLEKQISAVVNLQLSDLSTELRESIIQQVQGDFDGRIDNVVNLKVAGLSQEIKKSSLDLITTNIEDIKTDVDQKITENINITIQERSSDINDQVIEKIQGDIDEKVNNVVNLRISECSSEITRQAIEQIKLDLDKKIDAVVNLKLTDLTTELNERIIQQVQGDFDGRINNVVNLKVGSLSQNIKKSTLDAINADIESIKAELDQKISENINVTIDDRSTEINNQVIENIQTNIDEKVNNVVNLRLNDRSSEITKQAIEQIKLDLDKKIDAVVNLQVTNLTPEINNLIANEIQTNVDQRIDTVVNLKTSNLPQNIKNLVIQQIKPDLDRQVASVVNKSTENNTEIVINNIMGDIDNKINLNFDNRILNFRDDVTSIVRNEIDNNNEEITTNVLANITNQQFFLDMGSIKAEVDNFYSRLGQFETQLYARIEQGDTQLYNWTLEQLTALQGCLSDRQTLSHMFESFAAQLKEELDNAPCVQPTRFTPMTATFGQNTISPAQPQQLPGK
ncbi:MAG: hypothetical protein AAGE84_21680 [Cyanobacteria bacterium P01_G01_bin.39]